MTAFGASAYFVRCAWYFLPLHPTPPHGGVTGFLGRFEYTLDQKGRVSLPAEFRRKAGDTRFVLLQWESTHLTLFPETVWEEDVKPRLLGLRRERRDLGRILRDVMSRATEVVPDKQGRILVPAWLKDRARLDGPVMVVGGTDRIEIWDLETFKAEHPEEMADDAVGVEEIHEIFG